MVHSKINSVYKDLCTPITHAYNEALSATDNLERVFFLNFPSIKFELFLFYNTKLIQYLRCIHHTQLRKSEVSHNRIYIYIYISTSNVPTIQINIVIIGNIYIYKYNTIKCMFPRIF